MVAPSEVTLLTRLYPFALALLRIVAAFLFWQHGAQKMFGWFGGNPVSPFGLLWFAGILECFVAPLLIVGLFTRRVAFVLSGQMAVAFFIAHFPRAFWPIENQGVVPLQFSFIFLLLATSGPGAWSVDGLLARHAIGKPDWFRERLEPLYPAALTLLRVMTAFLFWQFGVRKLFGWLGGRAVEGFSLRLVAGVLEAFGGPLIALGAFTRPLAFLLSGEMAFAYWMSHFPRGTGFWPIENGGEASVLFCFIYLFLVTAGPGPLSLDGLFAKKKSA